MHFLLPPNNSVSSSSKNAKPDSPNSAPSKEKETGFFKRLFKHDKEEDEESKKATGTP